jgi:hypothetical protein
MTDHVSAEEARSSLATVDLGRRRVLDEVALPRWYWAGLAVGWVVLGVLADSASPVVSGIATLVFGAAHAAVAPRVLDGRHGSRRLQVRAGLVPRRLPWLIIGFLVVLSAATVAGALAVSADGAQHPVTITSAAVAVAILLGGPQLLTVVRRRARRGLSPA